MKERKLLSAADLADELGVPLSTLYGWRYRGVGPASIRVGRLLRYRRSDVDAWLAEQTDSPRRSA